MYHITFAKQSNRASWAHQVLITDLDDNPIDISTYSLTFAVSRQNDDCDVLVASTENGKLTVIGLGKARWFFTRGEMSGLRPEQYKTGLTITNDDGTQTQQLSVGPLAIVDGVVP